MVLKSILAAGISAMLLTGVAMAGEYRPGDFFNLDLLKAALSPDPLGPPAHFEQVPIEANAPDKVEASEAKVQRVERTHVRKPRHTARAKPAIARAKLARRSHGNPMDAQARDTRIQVWPCRSGGICNWQRSR
jgi:hypothetical protein